jgi:hypothetical protein
VDPFACSQKMYAAIAHAWAVGFGLGAYALLAELPNSFIKRRVGILSGHPATRWRALAHLVDQIDLLVGFYLVLACFVPLDAGVSLPRSRSST